MSGKGQERPRIGQGNTVQKPELIRTISRATGLVEATLDYGIKELRDKIIEFTRSGRAVKVDGSFEIQYLPDTALVNGLNAPGTFTGTIHNRENIGKTGDELVARWNEEYPEDPVAVTSN